MPINHKSAWTFFVYWFFYYEVQALYDNKVKSVVEQPLLNNLSGFWEMQFKCLPPRKKAEFTFSI